MPAPAIAPTLTLSLDREVGVPLQNQIMQQLRSAILSGRPKPGTVIPSTRALARDIGVARQTVVAAYERLQMEGYLEGRAGSATRVSTVLPELLLHVEHKGK